jgi:hypothetical protein
MENLGTLLSSLNMNPRNAIFTIVAMVLIWWIWSALDWIWFTPKRIEKRLKQQGLKGNSYRLMVGDIRDMVKMIKEAKSKPMDPYSNDIAPRVLPFVVHTIAKYGTYMFCLISFIKMSGKTSKNSL